MAEMNQEVMTKTQLEYLRTKRTKEMRHQLVSFGLMIFLTFMAFGLAASDVPAQFTIPIVLGFAFMKDNGHDFAKLFIMTGIYFAIAFVVCFIYIVWIGAPIE